MIIRILLTGTTLLLLTLVASVGAAAGAEQAGIAITGLDKVRAYAAATRVDGRSYTVDGGRLYAGVNGVWKPLAVPGGVIVNAVEVDRSDSNTVFIGAANRLSIFVSRDAGEGWMEVPLDLDTVGGVTALAFDASNRLLYAGTDADGVYRLRDIGAEVEPGLIASGHLLLAEPVQEIAADSTGAGLAFVRTLENLYRAEAFGLRWVAVNNLPGLPTAVVVADTSPPRVYVGTAGAGVQVSWDGASWRSVNHGLANLDGDQLVISDLAVDPVQPEVMYAATGLVAEGAHQGSSAQVAMSTDGGAQWEILAGLEDAQVADLLPVTGRTGKVYVLTTASRTPLALGGETYFETVETAGPRASAVRKSGQLAWILAGHASAALIILAIGEFKSGGRGRVSSAYDMRTVQVGWRERLRPNQV